MRRSRVALFTTIAAVTLLAACSSSKHATPAPTTTQPAPSTTATTPTTVAPTTSSTALSSSTTIVAAPTTTTTVSTAAQIVTFTGPPSPVVCNAPTSVELHWVTKHATSVTLRINGGPVFAKYSNGKQDQLAPLACDGTPQTYLLTATGGGRAATRSLTLAERESS